ncbi:MAG: leucyl/phenylalanyl-tRNA--protein transferase [Deltaproteobacteria bacterium]|nr:leucyl/phenylalanyl-tRNA--protein transferase [Deltaproteobacteria bacterium]
MEPSKKIEFPPVEWAARDGLLAMGGNLELETLLSAYQHGIFPWPSSDGFLLWFSPPKRAILEFSEFHFPKRLKQYLKKTAFEFRVNTNFKAVVEACARSKNRKKGEGTWILPEMVEAYSKLHEAGYAISFEAYNAADKLVGGLYGVKIANYFAGESMFYRESFASQFVMLQTVNYLASLGFTWMDVQVLNPHLQKFGVKEIKRALFLEKLNLILREIK